MTNTQKFAVGDKVKVQFTTDEHSWRNRDGHIGVVERNDGATAMSYRVDFPDASCYELAHGWFDELDLVQYTESVLLSPLAPVLQRLQAALAKYDGEQDGTQLEEEFSDATRQLLNAYGIPELQPIRRPTTSDFVRIVDEGSNRHGEIGQIQEDDKTDLPYRVTFRTDDWTKDYDWFEATAVELVEGAVEPARGWVLSED